MTLFASTAGRNARPKPREGPNRREDDMAGKTVRKTIQEINERIKKGKAVVLTAGEMTELVKSSGAKAAAKEVDVVATGTFSTMCSSGILFNIGQEPPVMKVSRLLMNGVPAYSGLAAVDAYMGCTEPREDDPLNKVYPGRFLYGGGHVIEDLVRGKKIRLEAEAYGTDCYPRKELTKDITLADLPQCWLLNPRNCYQNYNAAVNMGHKTIYTYMGPLKPGARNVNFATAGEYSPLFNDPLFKTIGLGTRILLGGGIGYCIGHGTQHVARPQRTELGLPLTPSGTLMLKGDLKQMSAEYLRGMSVVGYGCSLAVGVGIPIPVLDEDIARHTGVSDADIKMPIKDYGYDYPNGKPDILGHATFEELLSGEVRIKKRSQPIATVPVTSRPKCIEVAEDLKKRIQSGKFLLTEKVEEIPAG